MCAYVIVAAMASPPPQSSSVSQQFMTLITTAFGIVAALAWSDALSGYFHSLGLFRQLPMLGPFLYAAVLTLLAYMVGRTLGQYASQPCTRLCAVPTPSLTPLVTSAPAQARDSS